MSKSNLAPGFKRFEYRSGLEGVWGGMYMQGDAAATPAFRPRLIINGRIPISGEIRERPGLTAHATIQASSCIRHIIRFEMPTPLKLYASTASNGCPGIDPPTGFAVVALDMEQNPEVQNVVYYNNAASALVMGKLGKDLYLGTDATLRKFQSIPIRWGTTALAVSGAVQDTPIGTFTGFTIKCMLEFDGMLFIGLDNGAGASKVVTWDGVSFRDDMTGIDPPVCFALYRVQNGGNAIVMATSTSQTIYIRASGQSPVAWTTLGAGIPAVDMVSYGDVLYIADGAGNVRSWNGAAFAVARSPASATAVRAVTVFNALLYFGYETATAALIGKYDGSTWTDAEKNLTTQFAGFTSVRALTSYRGHLIGAGIKSSNGFFYVSPGTTTTGTWVEIATTAGSNKPAFSRLLVA